MEQEEAYRLTLRIITYMAQAMKNDDIRFTHKQFGKIAANLQLLLAHPVRWDEPMLRALATGAPCTAGFKDSMHFKLVSEALDDIYGSNT